MLTMNTTLLIFYIGVLTLALFDLGLVVFRGKSGSISQVLITTAFQSPLVTFAFGCTAGHLFFNMWLESCALNQTERFIVAACGAGFGAGCTELVRAFWPRK